MEFKSSISIYLFQSRESIDSRDHLNKQIIENINTGELFTYHGPPTYEGDILDCPNLVWAEVNVYDFILLYFLIKLLI